MAGPRGRVRGGRFCDARGSRSSEEQNATAFSLTSGPLWLRWMENPKCVARLMRGFVDGGE